MSDSKLQLVNEAGYPLTKKEKLSNKKGKQDIEKGDYYELRNKKDIDNFFKNIESGQTNEQFHHKIRGQG